MKPVLGKAPLVSPQEIRVNKGKLPSTLPLCRVSALLPLMLEMKTAPVGAELPGDTIDSAGFVCWLAGNLAEPVHLPDCKGSQCCASSALRPASSPLLLTQQSSHWCGCAPASHCPPC